MFHKRLVKRLYSELQEIMNKIEQCKQRNVDYTEERVDLELERNKRKIIINEEVKKYKIT